MKVRDLIEMLTNLPPHQHDFHVCIGAEFGNLYASSDLRVDPSAAEVTIRPQ